MDSGTGESEGINPSVVTATSQDADKTTPQMSKSYDQSDIAAALTDKRLIKDLSEIEEISIVGGVSNEAKEIFNKSEDVLAQMEATHSEWIDQKRMLLNDYLAEVPAARLRAEYMKGLKYALHQEYKLRKKYDDSASNLSDSEHLQDVITAYTTEFYRTLRICERKKIGAITAITIARNTHYHDPNTVIELTQKYKDLSPSVITSAMADNPTNTDAYLQGLLNDVASLSPQYPELTRSDIIHFVTSYKNPEPEIRAAINRQATLLESYPDLPASIIKRAAFLYPERSEEFLKEMISNIEYFSNTYPNISPFVIQALALEYKRPLAEELLKELNTNIEQISDKFPGLTPAFISRAVSERGRKVQEYLNTVVLNLHRLEKERPDVPRTILLEAATREDPDTFVNETIETMTRLQKQFPDMNRGSITRVILQYKEKPEVQLLRIQQQTARLSTIFPQFSTSLIRNAAIGYPINPEAFLSKLQPRIDSLTTTFPSVPRWVLLQVSVGYFSRSEDFLQKLQQRVTILSEKYTDKPKKLIWQVAYYYPDNPDNYLSKKDISISPDGNDEEIDDLL